MVESPSSGREGAPAGEKKKSHVYGFAHPFKVGINFRSLHEALSEVECTIHILEVVQYSTYILYMLWAGKNRFLPLLLQIFVFFFLLLLLPPYSRTIN